MNRAARIAIALGVIAAGFALAIFFGRTSKPDETPAAEVAESEKPPSKLADQQKTRTEAPSQATETPEKSQLLGRIGPPPGGGTAWSSTGPSAALPPQETSQVRAQLSEPLETSSTRTPATSDPPPAATFSAPDRASHLPPTSSWEPASGAHSDIAHRAAPAPRTHTIRDGDTLSYLAQRYLGSPERHLEIFAANRDVLDHPDLLPIGTKLKIPSGKVTTRPAATSNSSDGGMVPLPRRVQSRLGG